jgi:glycine/D-amino acid oxidase-like deaminating enzyme
MAQVIVVGGGLAGLSAAHTILERGGNVLLLDKQPSVRRLRHAAHLSNLPQIHGRQLDQGHVWHQRCGYADAAGARYSGQRQNFLRGHEEVCP